jgi:23S rRNA (guanosine2251-2'-O)-methyltransferase
VPENTLPVIEAVLDNIRSTFNVGAMFRTADGAGLRHIHLCGITPMPEHPRVAKTSLGAEYAVPWTYYENGVETVKKLKLSGMKILALEIGADSVSLFDAARSKSTQPIALVIGNEVNGIDPGILEFCDQQVWIPMLGYKRSLNAAIAFAVAAYTLRFVI